MDTQTQKDRIANTCVHFTSIFDKCCKADINYKALLKGGEVVPCLPLQTTKQRAVCRWITLPTQDEVQAKMDSFKDVMILENQIELLKPALDRIKQMHKGTSWRGVIPCPVCGDRLGLTHQVNGHVKCMCATKNCLCWRE